MKKWALVVMAIIVLAGCTAKQSNPEHDFSDYSTVAYHFDMELGDYARYIQLSGDEQQTFQKLLQTEQWQKPENLPERGYTVIFTASNREGDSVDVAEWDEKNSLIVLRTDSERSEKVFYLAPLSVSEDATRFIEKLESDNQIV